MNLVRSIYIILLATVLGSSQSCNKKEFLDKKPNIDLLIPATLEDMQTLLDNEPKMSETPGLGELSADNFYLIREYWQGLGSTDHNAYIWSKDIYHGEGSIADWVKPYEQVFYSNVILKGLQGMPITADNVQQYNVIKGSALFIRAYAFHNVAQVFAPVYDAATAQSDMGIPIRLNPSIDEASKRASVQQTYDQVLNDLQEASRLLPDAINFNFRNRPCKPAAFALLARVYLSMRQYDKAGIYADSCLRLYNTLINYNNIPNGNFPFEWSNAETMYQSKISTSNVLVGFVNNKNCIVDSTLYQSYASNDKRDSLFFSTGRFFTDPPGLKGSYTGTIYLFSGLATDEVYLIRAECYARSENAQAALNDLNALLRNRIDSLTFVPYTTSTVTNSLQLILTERRKELPFRGLRWTDIRRLNKEEAGIVLKRIIDGQPYELPANDKRFVLPIPPDVIALSGIPQNPRE